MIQLNSVLMLMFYVLCFSFSLSLSLSECKIKKVELSGVSYLPHKTSPEFFFGSQRKKKGKEGDNFFLLHKLSVIYKTKQLNNNNKESIFI